MKKLIFTLIFVALASCATSINKKNVSIHAQSAQNAIQNNDWNSARIHWAKATKNAELANESEQKLAIFFYEYGRSLGVTCFYEDAEAYLNKAKNIDAKTNGPVYMSLIELARLNLDQNKYEISKKYFDEVFPILDNLNMKDKSPMEYSFLLDEYSDVLSKSGETESAIEKKQQAENIRENNQKRFSITERTMYGSQCSNK